MTGWQWHQLDHMQIICTSLQTDNHASTPPLSFFTGRMPFLPPNQQRQSTAGKINIKLNQGLVALYIVQPRNVRAHSYNPGAFIHHIYVLSGNQTQVMHMRIHQAMDIPCSDVAEYNQSMYNQLFTAYFSWLSPCP